PLRPSRASRANDQYRTVGQLDELVWGCPDDRSHDRAIAMAADDDHARIVLVACSDQGIVGMLVDELDLGLDLGGLRGLHRLPHHLLAALLDGLALLGTLAAAVAAGGVGEDDHEGVAERLGEIECLVQRRLRGVGAVVSDDYLAHPRLLSPTLRMLRL